MLALVIKPLMVGHMVLITILVVGILLGSYAGTSFGNGKNNVAIGYNAGPSELTTLHNRLYIDVGYYSQISSFFE